MNPPSFALPTLEGTYFRSAYLPYDRSWIGGAVFSHEISERDTRTVKKGDAVYRYILTRHLEVPVFDRPGPLIACMLNPSTATEVARDNTVERMRFAAFNLGYNALVVVNMFALRSTKPGALSRTLDPVGPQNDAAIGWAAELARANACPIVCGWGVNVAKKAAWLERARIVARRLADSGNVAFWRMTQGGHPEHPLYLPNPLTPFPWLGAINYAAPTVDPLAP